MVYSNASADVLLRERGAVAPVHLSKLFEGGVVERRERFLCRQLLQRADDRVKLHQIGSRFLGHAEAAMRDALEEPLGRKAAQRLSHRRATDLQPLAHVLLPNELTRRQIRG